MPVRGHKLRITRNPNILVSGTDWISTRNDALGRFYDGDFSQEIVFIKSPCSTNYVREDEKTAKQKKTALPRRRKNDVKNNGDKEIKEFETLFNAIEEADDYELITEKVHKDRVVVDNKNRVFSCNVIAERPLQDSSSWSIHSVPVALPQTPECSRKNESRDCAALSFFSPLELHPNLNAQDNFLNNETLSFDQNAFLTSTPLQKVNDSHNRSGISFTSFKDFNADNSFRIDNPSGTTFLQTLFNLCEQATVETWDNFQITCSFESCSKLGEGSYGEVFNLAIKNEKEIALKVIPLSDKYEKFNDDSLLCVCPCKCSSAGKFNRFDENGIKLISGDSPMLCSVQVIPELKITMELTTLVKAEKGPKTSCFVEFVMAKTVRGNYPNLLLEEWHKYEKKQPNDAYNYCPSHYSSDHQLFCLIATVKASVPLSKFKVETDAERYSIFFQTALSLAAAEEALEFEHRDLHNDNILVERLDRTRRNEKLLFSYGNKHIQLKSHGVKAVIIDFSLSRIKRGDAIFFYELGSDPNIFTADGEKEGSDYQYDIYRMMRDEIMKTKNGVQQKSCWSNFVPRTNLFWLHYLAKKLFSRKLPKIFKKLLSFDQVKNFIEDADVAKILNNHIEV